MKAIILSAGHGTRLLPLTDNLPKCLLEVAADTSILAWQLRQLAVAGIDDVVVVTGYRANKVAAEVERVNRDHGTSARVLENSDFANMDNIGSAWCASHEMNQDFIILNGDTLFRASIPTQLVQQAHAPIRVTLSQKSGYDDDDMKVSLDSSGQLTAVGKNICLSQTQAESIGMILFRGAGVRRFREKLDALVASPDPLGRGYYLAAIDSLARETPLQTCVVDQDLWCEIDFPDDLAEARKLLGQWNAQLLRAG